MFASPFVLNLFVLMNSFDGVLSLKFEIIIKVGCCTIIQVEIMHIKGIHSSIYILSIPVIDHIIKYMNIIM